MDYRLGSGLISIKSVSEIITYALTTLRNNEYLNDA